MTDNMKNQNKYLVITIWIAQALLSLTFLWAGFMKIFKPADLPFPWVKNNESLVLFTGIVDLIGGIGIILPSLFKMNRIYTKLASVGIILLMISAIGFHLNRGEAKDIGFNIFVIVLAGFIFWGGGKK